jgi:hypothetical protein
MPEVPEGDRVLELIRQSERALSTSDLKKAYAEKYGAVDAAFRRGMRWLPYDEEVKSRRMQDVIVQYDIGAAPTPWNPNMKLFFVSKKQIDTWAEYLKNGATQQQSSSFA